MVHTDNNFELVYADNLNSIYLSRNAKNEGLISQYGLANGTVDVYRPMTIYQNSGLANSLSTILWPFKNTQPEDNFKVLRKLYYRYIGISAPKLTAN